MDVLFFIFLISYLEVEETEEAWWGFQPMQELSL